jgi:hypothetical protein
VQHQHHHIHRQRETVTLPDQLWEETSLSANPEVAVAPRWRVYLRKCIYDHRVHWRVPVEAKAIPFFKASRDFHDRLKRPAEANTAR